MTSVYVRGIRRQALGRVGSLLKTCGVDIRKVVEISFLRASSTLEVWTYDHERDGLVYSLRRAGLVVLEGMRPTDPSLLGTKAFLKLTPEQQQQSAAEHFVERLRRITSLVDSNLRRCARRQFAAMLDEQVREHDVPRDQVDRAPGANAEECAERRSNSRSRRASKRPQPPPIVPVPLTASAQGVDPSGAERVAADDDDSRTFMDTAPLDVIARRRRTTDDDDVESERPTTYNAAGAGGTTHRRKRRPRRRPANASERAGQAAEVPAPPDAPPDALSDRDGLIQLPSVADVPPQLPPTNTMAGERSELPDSTPEVESAEPPTSSSISRC